MAWFRIDMAPWARLSNRHRFRRRVGDVISLSHVLPVQKWLMSHHLSTSPLRVSSLIALRSCCGLPHI